MKILNRNFISFVIATAIIKLGYTKRAKQKLLNGQYIICLCFHTPPKNLFESCVNWLSKNGFQFISINDLEKISRGEMEFPKGAVIITADDGWQTNYDNIVPIAKKNKTPVTIFLNPGIVENGDAYWWSYVAAANRQNIINQSAEYYKGLENDVRVQKIDELATQVKLKREALTVEQVKELSSINLLSMQSHTISHPILPKCSDEKLAKEITGSKKLIEEWTSKPVTHFAYPNGDYTPREITSLAQSGYTMAFTTNQRYITPGDLKNPYTLPRLLILEDASFEENICRMMGVWKKKRK
jgi:poly-beta-1,6-N-acetyl-D-glucosamine N-deacetylase